MPAATPRSSSRIPTARSIRATESAGSSPSRCTCDRKWTRAERAERVRKALDSVGLPADAGERFPHEFSGGQRQRIAIARALVNDPDLIIADEPVSALDVSIRAQILDLLSELRDRLHVAYLFISHDLSVMRAFCDEVMVMHDGKIVETGVTGEVLRRPQHEYTRTLVAAAPDLERAIAAAG